MYPRVACVAWEGLPPLSFRAQIQNAPEEAFKLLGCKGMGFLRLTPELLQNPFYPNPRILFEPFIQGKILTSEPYIQFQELQNLVNFPEDLTVCLVIPIHHRRREPRLTGMSFDVEHTAHQGGCPCLTPSLAETGLVYTGLGHYPPGQLHANFLLGIYVVGDFRQAFYLLLLLLNCFLQRLYFRFLLCQFLLQLLYTGLVGV